MRASQYGALSALPLTALCVAISATFPAAAQVAVNGASVAPPIGSTDPTNANNSATDSDNVFAAPQLSLVKTVNAPSMMVGAPSTYTLRVTNVGTAATSGVTTIVDTLAANLAGGAMPAGCSLVGQTVTCSIPSGLAINAFASFDIPVTPGAPLGGTSVTNTATVSGGGDATCPTDARCTSTIVTPVGGVATMTLSKTATVADTNGNGAMGDVGDVITYGFSVTNTGTVALAPVTVNDPRLPALACSIPSLAPGATTSCLATNNTYTITAADLAAGSVSNTATASGDAPGTIADATATDTETTPVFGNPLLTLAKTASAPNFDVGTPASYTLTVSNAGVPTTAAATIGDTIPTGLDIGAMPAGCSLVGRDVSCVIPAGLAHAASASFVIPVTPNAGAGGFTVTNTATLSGGGDATCPTDARCTSTVATPVGGVAAMTLAKTASVADTNGNGATGDVGDVITYTFSLTNTGSVALSTVNVTDARLPALVCNVPTLAPGATTSCAATGNTYTITAADLAAGSVSNTANATADAPGVLTDPTATDTEVTAVFGAPFLTLAKTASSASFDVGTPASYTLTVSNAGVPTTAAATIGDTIPTGLDIGAMPAGCSLVGRDVSCVVPVGLAHAASQSFVIPVTPNAAAGGLTVTNTATLSGGGDATCPTDARCTSTVATPVGGVASMTLAKTASVADTNGNGATGDVGDVITYTFSLTNTGSVALSTVNVTDARLPALVCNVPTLAPGATTSCAATGNTYTITAADLAAGSVSNTANATADAPGVLTDPTATDTEVTAVFGAPFLTLAKTASAASFDVGTPASYTLTVSNAGVPTTAAATIGDTIPTGLDIGAMPAGCSLVGRDVSCVIPAGLAHAASTSFVIPITPNAAAGGLTVTNTATLTGGGDATCPSDARCTSSVATPVGGVASMTLAKTATVADTNANGAVGDVGDVITYVFSLANTGTVALAPVTVNDPMLPALACSIPTLAPGANTLCAATGNTYTITAADLAAGSVSNTATATGDAPGTLADPTASDSEVTSVFGSPLLTLTKTASAPNFDVGTPASYTLTVANAGVPTTASATITDPIPNGLDIGTMPAGCSLVGRDVSCVIPAGLAHAASASFVIPVTPNAGAGGFTLTNTATLAGGGDATCPTDARCTSTVATPVGGVASMTLSKTALVIDTNGNAAIGDVGDTITYAFNVSNTGSVALSAIDVDDPRLPALACSLPSFAPGASASCVATGNSYTITAADLAAGSVSNTATATADAPGTLADPTATDTEVTAVFGSPLLTLAKTASAASFDVGTAATYTLTVSNAGVPTTAAAIVADTIPTTLDIGAMPAGCSLVGRDVTCTVPAGLAHAASAAFIIPVTPNATAGGFTVTNTATLSGGGDATCPSDARCTSSVSTPVGGVASLTLLKGATVADTDGNGAMGTVGDVITYTFSMTNTGSVALSAVTVDDPRLPSLGCTLPTLAPGATASCAATNNTWTITAADLIAGSVSNTATASGDAPGTLSDPTATDTAVTPVFGSPFLTLTKSASAPTFDVGTPASYTLTLSNAGVATTSIATITDQIPDGLDIGAMPADCTLAGRIVSCTVPAGLVLGASRSFVVPVTPNASAGGTTITNTASLIGGGDPGCPDTASRCESTVATPVGGVAGLALAKTATVVDANGNAAVGDANDAIDYAFELTNTGNVALLNVTVSDPRLPGLTCVVATLAPGAAQACVATGNRHVITAAEAAAGSVVNTATATGDAPGTLTDPTASDSVTTPTGTTPTPRIVLASAMTGSVDNDGDGVLSLGDTLRYAVTATNAGTVALNGVTIADDRIVPASASCAIVQPGANCVLTGETTVTQADIDAGHVVNNARVTTVPFPAGPALPPQGCPVDSADASCTATSSIAITQDPRIAIELAATLVQDGGTQGVGNAGDVIRYAVTVRNLGNTTLSQLVVTQAFERATGATLTCTPSTLAPATSVVCAPLDHTITEAEANSGAPIRSTISALARSVGATQTIEVNDSRTVATQVEPNITALRVEKRAGTSAVRIGDLVHYTVVVEDLGGQNIANATLIDTPPAGFAYVPDTLVVRDADGAGRLADDYPVRVEQLDIAPHGSATITYVLRVGAGVGTGLHRNSAFVETRTGRSNTATADVQVRGDALMEESLVVGTVFDDRDQDGWQDPGEPGLPGVRIASVEGLLAETDVDGRYHLAAIDVRRMGRGGKYVLKVDPATLPAGTTFVTPNPQLRHVTAGVPVRFDFAVRVPAAGVAMISKAIAHLDGGGTFWATESPDVAQARLEVQAPAVLARSTMGALEPVRFQVRSNYADFIQRAEILVFDAEDTDLAAPLATIPVKLDGDGAATWDGTLPPRYTRRSHGALAYIVRAHGKAGGVDETWPRRMVWAPTRARNDAVANANASNAGIASTGVSTTTGTAGAAQAASPQPASSNDASGLRFQNIPLQGSRVRLQARDLPAGARVTIDGQPQSIDPVHGLTLDAIVRPGVRKFDVVVDDGTGAQQRTVELNVTGQYLFAVALADLTASDNRGAGAVEPLQGDEAFDSEFLLEGRAAFYLKGKIRGKYLVTAQADTTAREVSRLFDDFLDATPQDVFRRLDPDRYYPVYGDDSTTTRDVDTQGKLYVRVDWDKSRAIWGNYSTAFTGTEYGQYSRALYGAALDYRSRRGTLGGEPGTTLRLFGAEAQSAPGHNEFTGTGGSLYYLKHTDVLAGSEHVVLELRDPTSGRVDRRFVLVPGVDYDLDEFQGRLMLTRSLAQVARDGQTSLTRTTPLEGHVQVLLVDYEYVPQGFDAGDATMGARGKQWFGDHVALGVTSIDEKRAGEDYRIRGGDLTLQASPGTFLKVERTHTDASAAPVFQSDNGGLSFTRRATDTPFRTGEATAIDARANLKGLGWTARDWTMAAWWRDVDDGFSVSRFDPGAQVLDKGAEVSGWFTDAFRLYARYSRAERDRDAFEQSQLTLQWMLGDRSRIGAEWRRVEETRAGGVAAASLIALQYGLKTGPMSWTATVQGATDRSALYADNDALILGAQYDAGDRATLGAEASTGDRGDAFRVDGEFRASPGHAFYAAYLHSPDGGTYDPLFDRHGAPGWTMGQRWQVTNTLNVFNESQLLDTGETGLSHTAGMTWTARPGWHVGTTLQQANLDSGAGNVDRNAVSVSIGRTRAADEWSSKVELRRDRGAEQREQWVTTHRVSHRWSDALRVAGDFDYARTTDDRNATAGAEFIEANTGFAWRPADSTRWTLFGKYTYLYDVSALEQVGTSVAHYDQRSHVFSFEGIYQGGPRWSVGGKAMRREGDVRMGRMDGEWADSTASFLAGQLRYGVRGPWHALAETRWLDVRDGGVKHGALVGIERDLGKHARLSAGYNFADFNDDLTNFDYNHRGFFLGLTGTY